MEQRNAYRILGDSCCDDTAEPGALDFLTRVPLTIELGGESFVDDGTLDCCGMLLERMRVCPEAPHSACPSPERFAALCGEGEGDVYIVTLSSKLSGTYNSAVLGAQMARDGGCRNNIHVFDSESAAAGEIAVCLKVRELAEQGLPFAQVVERTEAFIRKLTTLFLLETLDVFRKNGRLNHLQALAVGALKIKLVMGGERGQIVMRGKALTTPRAITKMIELVRQACEALDATQRTLVITHINCRARAEDIRDRLLAACPFGRWMICEGGGISTMYGNDGGIILAF